MVQVRTITYFAWVVLRSNMTTTVTPRREPESKGGMNLFGWLMFLGMLIVLVPLLPFYILLKLYDLVTSRGEPSQ